MQYKSYKNEIFCITKKYDYWITELFLLGIQVGELAGGEVAVAEVAQGRTIAGADLGGQRATGAEAAAGRDGDRTGHIALQRFPFAARGRIGDGTEASSA